MPACQSVDCVCVHARTVADARIAFDVLKGPDEGDIFSRTEDELPRRRAWGRALRFGTPGVEELGAMAEAYRGLWEEALEVVQGSGIGLTRSEEFEYAPFEAANELLYGS